MSLNSTTLWPATALPPPLYLIEEISHRVLNEYTAAIGDVSLAAAKSASAQARATLNEVAERLRVHAQAHRALLAPDDDRAVDLAEYLTKICSSLSKALLAERRIRLLAEMDEVRMDSGRSWRIGLIVSELIRNAVRHGLAGRSGYIRVVLSKTFGCVRCIVSDNGRAVTELQPGRGRRLVESLAAELGGTASWRFAPGGCLVEVEIPDPTDLPRRASSDGPRELHARPGR
jgi:two-component sensor histidine kinase